MHKEEKPVKPVYIVPMAGKRGMTALHYAAYCNDPDAVREQLKSGVLVDVRDDGGWTPLLWSIDMAQAWGEPERVVRLLLAAGVSANATNHEGFSVLMMACCRDNIAILDELIEAGADIHARTAGTTPLHEAASSNFTEAITRLLALGADPTGKDAQGLTPEQSAHDCGFVESEAILRAARLAT